MSMRLKIEMPKLYTALRRVMTEDQINSVITEEVVAEWNARPTWDRSSGVGQILALWSEGSSEYKVTGSIVDQNEVIQLREFSRRRGTVEWLPTNNVIRVGKKYLREFLEKS